MRQVFQTFRYSIITSLLCLTLLLAPFDLISNAQSSVDQQVQTMASALDENQNRVLDDTEILNAIQIWILGEAMPDGEVITDESILSLIQMWITAESVRPPLMGDDPEASLPVECIEWVGFLLPVEKAAPGTFVSKWHSPDTALAVDHVGNVYIAGHQITSEFVGGQPKVEFFDGIKKYDPNGVLLAKWDTSGSGDGKFRIANDMVIDGSGNIFIADQDMSGIQKLDANGKFVTKWGSHGSSDGQFWGSPGSLAVDTEGNVYATNLSNIQKFDNNGNFLRKWVFNLSGSSYDPSGIAVDIEGNIYTTDPTNNKIHKYDANGTLLTTWGSKGSGDGQFGWRGPRDLSVDLFGNVFVFDNGNYRIQKFDTTGQFVAKWGSVGTGNGQFSSGMSQGIDFGMMGGLAVDLGTVYVLDSRNHRIQKFCGGL